MKKLVFLIIFLLFTQINGFAQNPTQLEQGSVLEKSMKAGEVHTYSLKLADEDFVHIEIDQLGIDLSVELVDNALGESIVINTPDLFYFTESLYYLAKKNGSCTIKVFGTSKEAVGQYIIRIKQLRKVGSTDIHYLQGQYFFLEAEKLRAKADKDSFIKAISYYQKSITEWDLCFQKERSGICLNLIGETSYYLGDIDVAIKHMLQASELLTNSAKAQTLNNLGHLHFAIGEKDKALNFFNESVETNSFYNDKTIKVNTLNGIASIQRSLGKTEDALKTLYEVIDVANEVNYKLEFAAALHTIGIIFANHGEHAESLKFLNSALSVWQEKKLIVNEVSTLNAIGGAYLEALDLEPANKIYLNVLELAERTGQIQEKGIAFFGIGYIAYLKRDYENSLEFYTKALDIFSKINSTSLASLTSRFVGLAHAKLKRYDEALKFYTNAYELAKKSSVDNIYQALYRRAELHQYIGRFDLALNDIQETLKVYATREQTTNYQLKIFQSVPLNDIYKLYISILMDLHQQNPLKGYSQQAFELHEKSRASVLLNLIVEKDLNLHEIDQGLLDEEGQIQQKIIEKNDEIKALSKQENSLKVEKNKLERDLSLLILKLNLIQSKIRKNSPQYVTTKNTKTLTLEEIQGLLDANTTLLQYALGKDKTYLWVISNKTFNVYTLPKVEKIEALARQFINELRNRPVKTKFAKQMSYGQIDDFSQLILGQCVDDLQTERLLIVADGFLNQIPFSALIKPKKNYPLIVDHEVVNVSSISTLEVLKAKSRLASNSILIVSDPVLTPNDTRLKVRLRKRQQVNANINRNKINRLVVERFERNELGKLKFAAAEVSSIASIFRGENPKILSGINASLNSLLDSDISTYKIIHFIAHGFNDNDKPELSGLVLSVYDIKGENKTAYFTSQHISNLKLNADLTVLSACHTAFGKQVLAEGSIGLAYSFMTAGSERVLSTLWAIEDQSTSVFMATFYNEMKKNNLNPAAALRRAQIFMLNTKEWNAPYYWAAFQLQGNF